jgi:selenocysteine lyase/cysteine desulfurase
MPMPVLRAIESHLELEMRRGGYEAADAAQELVSAAYADVARLLGAQPRNIAVVENATVAFAQAMSAFDLRSGDVILTTRNDYVSNQLVYLSLQRRLGVCIVRAEDAPEGGVDPDSVRALIRKHRPRLVAVTWVPTNSGLVQPVESIGDVCRETGVPYLVDGCQAVGQLPIDVDRVGCDFLGATSRKFLRGPRGIGFLYVSDRALQNDLYPLFIDLRGATWTDPDSFSLAPDARRFENWEFAYALLLGLGEAARYALNVGIETGGRRAAELAARIRHRLAGDDGLRVLDRGQRLCAIVTAEVRGRDAGDVVRELRDAGVNVSAAPRSSAVIDMDEKRASSVVRLSPHYFNTEREVDVAVDLLAASATR